MKIGIDGSRAFLKQRTGIEEYSYQVIKHLVTKLNSHQVILYIRKDQESEIRKQGIFFPKNWKIKIINFPRLWTQAGLSLEMLFHPIDALFIPAHTVPIIHPAKTIVTIHGLEYEKFPQAYSFWERFYMWFSIKNSCRWASRIIAVSKNTKNDLMELYGVSSDKINVIYEGVDDNFQPASSAGRFPVFNDKIINPEIDTKYEIKDTKYLLFVGRLEERKNIVGMVSAFEILKEEYNIPHKLVLVGKNGYGAEKIKEKIEKTEYRDEIILPGFVSEEEKLDLMKNAEVFLFPTFYEGFGLPILEAQALGVPVVAANTSSLPEIGDYSAAYCDPTEPKGIADAIHALISDSGYRNNIIKKGMENVKRFSWEKCAEEIAGLLVK